MKNTLRDIFLICELAIFLFYHYLGETVTIRRKENSFKFIPDVVLSGKKYSPYFEKKTISKSLPSISRS